MSVGYLFKKYNIFPEQTPQVLNLFIVYISLPAMVLLEVPRIEFTDDIFIPIFVPFVVTLIGAFTIYFFSKIFKWNDKTTGALLLVGVLGNTSFLGIPIVNFYLGSTALPYVMIYDQLGTFLLLNTYGVIVIAIYSSEGKINVSNIMKKIFLFPPFVALIVAFGLHGINLNSSFIDILTTLANTLIPVALISVGYSLQLKIPKEDFSAFSLGLITKLLLIPLYAYIIVFLFSFEGLASDVSILESAMGPMITAGIVASMAGFSQRLSSSIIGYGVLFSFITTYIVVSFI